MNWGYTIVFEHINVGDSFMGGRSLADGWIWHVTADTLDGGQCGLVTPPDSVISDALRLYDFISREGIK